MITLYTAPKTGGDIPEYVLRQSGLRYERKVLDYDALATDAEYAKINPLKQVPAARLEDGSIMTESLAICTYVCERSGLDLVPRAGEPERAAYLRWSTYLVASIYPTFSFGDDPSRFVKDKAAQRELQEACIELRKRMWSHVETAASASGPWFLGMRHSLIDVYLTVMTLWRPRQEWFAAECPRITRIAAALRAQAPFL
jgi:GST-like protein